MHMLAEQRRMKILELLQEEGSARVKQLCELFHVTEPTIRQDLQILSEKNFIVRDHGGAFLKSVPSQVRNLTLQRTENQEKKEIIARKAAEFINNGDSVILDSGSSVTAVAQQIVNKKNLTIVTNALNIALILGAEYGFTVMMTGGEFKPPTLSLTGDKAASFFAGLHLDKLFLACLGISAEGELTYPGLSDIPVKKAMIASADTVFLVADSTKLGRSAFASLGGIEQVDCLITDNGITEQYRTLIESKGVKIIIAE